MGNDNQKEDYSKQFDIVKVYVNDIKQEIEDNEHGDIMECTNDINKEILDGFSVKEGNNANPKPKENQDDPNEHLKATKNVANSGNSNEEKGLTEVCRERKSGKRSHLCGVCGTSFAYKEILRKHISTIHKKKCLKCGKLVSNLKSHTRKKHSSETNFEKKN